MKLELVSFPLCPFVHRTMIMLHEKGVGYDLRYVDLENKPEWLLAISPRGKVPVLVVDGKPLFESAVIDEFLDETCPPRLLPQEPFERARHRAWIVVADDFFAAHAALMGAPDEGGYVAARGKLEGILGRVEQDIRGEFFAGSAVGLVDVAFAPAFYRLVVLERKLGLSFMRAFPRTEAWARRLAARPSVRSGLVSDFEARYMGHLTKRGGWVVRLAA